MPETSWNTPNTERTNEWTAWMIWMCTRWRPYNPVHGWATYFQALRIPNPIGGWLLGFTMVLPWFYQSASPVPNANMTSVFTVFTSQMRTSGRIRAKVAIVLVIDTASCQLPLQLGFRNRLMMDGICDSVLKIDGAGPSSSKTSVWRGKPKAQSVIAWTCLKPHFPHDLLCIKHGALTRSDFRRWFGAGGPKKQQFVSYLYWLSRAALVS